MNSISKTLADHPSVLQNSYRVIKHTHAWLKGVGHMELSANTLIKGAPLAVNDHTRSLVIQTNAGILKVNQEDVEPYEFFAV